MSSLKQTYGDDYPDAAEKHLNDANSLLNAQRFDGAAYLSGYIVECSLKALIQFETGQVSKDHEFDIIHKKMIRLCAQANSKTAKYVSSPAIQNLLKCNIVNWKPGMRYSSEGNVSPADSQKWVTEANEIFVSTIIEMKLDRVIT
jgi:hypothetical protein